MAVKMRSATNPRTKVSILNSCQNEQLSVKETKQGGRKEQRERAKRDETHADGPTLCPPSLNALVLCQWIFTPETSTMIATPANTIPSKWETSCEPTNVRRRWCVGEEGSAGRVGSLSRRLTLVRKVKPRRARVRLVRR